MNDLVKLQWEQFLSQHNLRLTPQRDTILDAIHAFENPFTAEELIEKIQNTQPITSRATLYRTLQLLVQAHILREIDAGKECKYYALCLGTKNFQAQIICDDCNKICEMDAPFMSWYSESAAKKLNMEALSARLQITAKCKVQDCPETKALKS